MPTDLPGVMIVEPCVFSDARGFFLETWNRRQFQTVGIDVDFVQDNHSHSVSGVVRGLHYQIERPQAKLVWVVRGEIYDVGVDLRRSSPTFGRWTAVALSAENRRQVYFPAGIAHGFCALSPDAEVAYKCSDYYDPDLERTISWNDSQLAIDWPISAPFLSAKDSQGMSFDAAPKFD
jgi:dTDP-4-dehydrorhamnose 3,5-epimerase